MIRFQPVHSMPQRRQCLEVYREAMDYFARCGLPYPSRSTVADDRTGVPAGVQGTKHYALICDDAQVVGVIAYVTGCPRPGVLTLQLLLIPTQLRGRGYGTAALATLAAQAASAGDRRIALTVVNATPSDLTFWRHRGFAIVTRDRVAQAAGTYHDVTTLRHTLAVPVTE
ncbi:GNAT family N-acetyltransferase [Lacticaseibacillus absianus]|uniref:GNAT family N-acetyltransferase n=1 Tax=Lacticaseibacillus absianus TaxID=2729623 RepID=UPI0015CAC27A|nr:GNAT family N-acetyltransferase [Lacticaseibacillus absianus]